MIKVISNKYLLLLCRLILGFVFIYAGAEKISDPGGFAQSIIHYKLFPLIFVNIFAVIIPWVEISAGLLLLFGIAVKESSAILSILLIVFIILITISLFRGLNIDCGCFGSGSSPDIGIQKVIEDVLLLISGILLILFDSRFLSIQNKN